MGRRGVSVLVWVEGGASICVEGGVCACVCVCVRVCVMCMYERGRVAHARAGEVFPDIPVTSRTTDRSHTPHP